jgi:DNA (cytosine-5)-methyltransferase 1
LVEGADPAGTDATDGVWRDPDWLLCRDGRWRPVEPGTFPLADGIPSRVGLLRGYGNAIVPPLAAEFVTAFLESLPKELG